MTYGIFSHALIRSAAAIAFVLGALVLLVPVRADAAPEVTFNVNSTADKPDANPGDGVCVTARGACTLRAAIMEANANPNKDTIYLPAGNYVLTRVGKDNNALRGDLDIRHKLDIVGAGVDVTFIDGNGDVTDDRVFTIFAFSKVTMTGIQILFGETTGNGGAIYSTGTLTLNDSYLNGNMAKNGGGIYNASTQFAAGSLTLNNTTVINNTAAMDGGAIYNKGALALNNSTIEDNEAQSGGGGIFNRGTMALMSGIVNRNTAGGGGGIFSDHGMVTISHSTISHNTSAVLGGGIINLGTNDNHFSVMTLSDSTVSGNTADSGGGGIHNSGDMQLFNTTVSGNTARDGGGISHALNTLRMTNSTISGNVVRFDGGGVYVTNNGQTHLFNVTIANNIADDKMDGSGLGGGIFVAEEGNGKLHLQNTLVADNYNRDPSGGGFILSSDNCAGALISHGYNLIYGVPPACTIGGNVVGNITAQDAMFDILENNGGPTLTHRLELGSPAIDSGNPAGCVDFFGALLTTDQRGEPRPTDGDGRDGARCDIGAFEK